MLKSNELKNKIREKLSSVPEYKLQQIYKIISGKTKQAREKSENILSYAGIWKEMSNKELTDFLRKVNTRRKDAFSGRVR